MNQLLNFFFRKQIPILSWEFNFFLKEMNNYRTSPVHSELIIGTNLVHAQTNNRIPTTLQLQKFVGRKQWITDS